MDRQRMIDLCSIVDEVVPVQQPVPESWWEFGPTVKTYDPPMFPSPEQMMEILKINLAKQTPLYTSRDEMFEAAKVGQRFFTIPG